MATINYTPGQIIHIESSMGPWSYISFLRCAKPGSRIGESYELHTCCDLCIDLYESNCLTLARGNGSLLDNDTSFENIREATNEEKVLLYDALVKAFKDHDLEWDKHFTDSTYYDILDWLEWEFNVETSSDGMSEPDPVEIAMYEMQDYIWDALCKETGNYQEETPEPEMVNKKEFIAKIKKWLEIETDWNMEYDEEGRNPNYGKIDELIKYLEE